MSTTPYPAIPDLATNRLLVALPLGERDSLRPHPTIADVAPHRLQHRHSRATHRLTAQSAARNRFRGVGLFTRRRGAVALLGRDGLENATCECYRERDRPTGHRPHQQERPRTP